MAPQALTLCPLFNTPGAMRAEAAAAAEDAEGAEGAEDAEKLWATDREEL